MQQERNSGIVRVPVTFDCSDPTQKLVCDLLQNAGYGKRTPIVVKAVCLLMGSAASSAPPKEKPEQRDEISEAVIEKAVENVLRRYLPELVPGKEMAVTGIKENEPALPPAAAEENGRELIERRITEYDVPPDVLAAALNYADMFGQ